MCPNPCAYTPQNQGVQSVGANCSANRAEAGGSLRPLPRFAQLKWRHQRKLAGAMRTSARIRHDSNGRGMRSRPRQCPPTLFDTAANRLGCRSSEEQLLESRIELKPCVCVRTFRLAYACAYAHLGQRTRVGTQIYVSASTIRHQTYASMSELCLHTKLFIHEKK